jgi:hypothetical protein
MYTASYAWIFNPGTGLYDATLAAIAQPRCGDLSFWAP